MALHKAPLKQPIVSMNLHRSDFLKLSLTTLGALSLGCGGEGSTTADGAGGVGTGGSGGDSGSTGGTSSGGSASGGSASGGSASGGSASGGSASGGSASGGSATGGNGAGDTCGADLNTRSSGPIHQHNLTVTAAQIAAGAQIQVKTSTSNSHSHLVTITAADFAILQSGGTVIKTTCDGGDHEFVLSCGTPSRAPALPTCCQGDSAAGCPN